MTQLEQENLGNHKTFHLLEVIEAEKKRKKKKG